MRIVSVSDIHLGRRSSRVRKVSSLVPLFRGADLAVINGDGVDFGWTPLEEALRWREELLAALQGVAGRVVWVRGNHDLPLDGPILHREGDLVFTHGHALFDVPPGARTYLEAFDGVYEGHFRRHSTHRHGGPISNLADCIAAHIIPLALASRWEIGDPRTIDLSLLLDAAGPGVGAVVMGHLHITGILPRGEEMLYVTGAWTGRAPATAFVRDGGHSALHRIVLSPDGFALGEVIPAPSPHAPPVLTSW